MPEPHIEHTWTRTRTETFTYKQPLSEFIDEYADKLAGRAPEALSAKEITELVADDLTEHEEEYYRTECDSDVEFVSHQFI
ncbi:hypothetical protein [Nocardia sp. NPDC127526]|uniref:hypothetical protein n=1 Tax=Nocardia sp. NPDC127526 TaxID=3345393 RepID=UPI00363B0912